MTRNLLLLSYLVFALTLLGGSLFLAVFGSVLAAYSEGIFYQLAYALLAAFALVPAALGCRLLGLSVSGLLVGDPQ